MLVGKITLTGFSVPLRLNPLCSIKIQHIMDFIVFYVLGQIDRVTNHVCPAGCWMGCTARRRPIVLRIADRLRISGLPFADNVR